MARARTTQSNDSVPSSEPSVPPPFGGHHDHSFTLQAVLQMQQSIGEMKASVDNLSTSVQSMKSKVDDLVCWKNRILGGAIVLGLVCSIIGFLASKFSEYVTISAPVKAPPSVSSPAQLPTVAPPAR